MNRIGIVSVLFVFSMGINAFAMGFLGGGGGGGSQIRVSMDPSISLIDSIKITESMRIREIDSFPFNNLEFWVKNESNYYIWSFAVGVSDNWNNTDVIIYPNKDSDGQGWKGFKYWKSLILPVNLGQGDNLKAYLEKVLNDQLDEAVWNEILTAFDYYSYAYFTYFAIDEVDKNGNLLYPYNLIAPGDELGVDKFGILSLLQIPYGSPFLVLVSEQIPNQGQDFTVYLKLGETRHNSGRYTPNRVLVPEPNSLVLLLIGVGGLPFCRRFR